MNRNKHLAPESRTEISDARLGELLRERLPQAQADGWFVRKVMNRLPDKPRRRQASTAEAVCYLLSILGLAGAWGYAFHSAVTDGLTVGIATISGILTLLTLFVIGIFVFPYLRRALN